MSTTPPSFPQLSRKPALKQREQTLDPTLRDSYENGMESTRAKFLRRRRTFDVTIEFLSPADKRRLDEFVEIEAVYGSQIFFFSDPRDPHNPVQRRVRFSTLPAYMDTGWTQPKKGAGYFGQTCTFQLREV